ncbi:MAG TPA: MogA/MoaB family molybdenum cofactor biosynthesis protein [Acidisarcina sp.]
MTLPTRTIEFMTERGAAPDAGHEIESRSERATAGATAGATVVTTGAATARNGGGASLPGRRAALITVSDSSFAGERVDLSGPAVAKLLIAEGFLLVEQSLVPDEQEAISRALLRSAEGARLVVTTGGTGLAPRDVTPEATRQVCDRVLHGLAELMRAEGRRETPFAALGRGVCGSRGATLIVNLPGSPRGAVSSLKTLLPLIPHALALLAGEPVTHSHGADGGAEDSLVRPEAGGSGAEEL